MSYYPCRKIQPISAYSYEGISSDNDPVWYHEQGKVYVLPSPGASPDQFKVLEVKLPSSVDASGISTIGAIASLTFPTRLDGAVVLYAVIQGKKRAVEKFRRDAQDEMEFITTSGYLSDFEGALPTITMPVAPTQTLSYTSAGNAPASTVTPGSSLPTYDGPSNVVIDISAINDALSSNFEDTNIAVAEVQKARTEIEEFSANMRRAVEQFRSEMDKYQSRVREEVEEIGAGIRAYDSKARDNFNTFKEEESQYQLDITKYQAEVGSEVNRVQQALAKASGYLSEAGVRIQTMQSFEARAGSILSEINLLQQEYLNRISAFIGGSK